MRNIPWIVIALVFAVALVPNAKADTTTYNIDFAVDVGGSTIPTPPIGSFTYDSDTDVISPFTVTWDGTQYSFTGTSGSAPVIPVPDTWYADSNGGYLVLITSIDPTAVLVGSGTSFLGPDGIDETAAGTLTTSVATPEPGTSSLLLIGVGLLGFVMVTRKRFAKGLQQAAATP